VAPAPGRMATGAYARVGQLDRLHPRPNSARWTAAWSDELDRLAGGDRDGDAGMAGLARPKGQRSGVAAVLFAVRRYHEPNPSAQSKASVATPHRRTCDRIVRVSPFVSFRLAGLSGGRTHTGRAQFHTDTP
jgi:hypothetical protein